MHYIVLLIYNIYKQFLSILLQKPNLIILDFIDLLTNVPLFLTGQQNQAACEGSFFYALTFSWRSERSLSAARQVYPRQLMQKFCPQN